MKRTETPKRYGRRAPIKEERNAALLAVPAASTKGSTGRQQVKAARTLPTAESAAASAPFEEGLPVVVIVSVFIGCSFPLNESHRPAQSLLGAPLDLTSAAFPSGSFHSA